MNERDTRLSVALDALTELQESMDQHHGHAVNVVPINHWEDLTASARECIEETIGLNEMAANERSAA